LGGLQWPFRGREYPPRGLPPPRQIPGYALASTPPWVPGTHPLQYFVFGNANGNISPNITYFKFSMSEFTNDQNMPFEITKQNQTVNDGVAHSKNPRKCAYHVIFDLDLDLEHTLDAR